jgi:hypothetical protein
LNTQESNFNYLEKQAIQLVLDSKNGIDYVTTHEDIISMFHTVEKNILLLAIEDPMFYSLAKMICDALSPLCTLLVVLESDYATLSYAWYQLTVFEQYLSKTELVRLYPDVLKYFQTRMAFIYTPVVGIANLLDPRYRGDQLTLIQKQEVLDNQGNLVELQGKGRHDPCVLPRAVPIVEAMTALVLADHYLRNRSSRI